MSILRGLVLSMSVVGLATSVGMTGCAERPGVKKEDKDKDKSKSKDDDKKKKSDKGDKKKK